MRLRLLLFGLGVALWLGSLVSKRFRGQISRHRVVQISSRDGVACHYVFQNRSVQTRSGRSDKADAEIIFSDSGEAIGALLSPQLMRILMDGVLEGRTRIEGNLYLLLWFYGLVLQVFPITRPPQLPNTPPNAFTKPNPSSLVSDRIVREPVAQELDPMWTEARAARSQLLMYSVDTKGDEPPSR